MERVARRNDRVVSLVPAGLHPVAWLRFGRFWPHPEQVFTLNWSEIPMLPEVGRFEARAKAASVYESEGGALMLALAFGEVGGVPDCGITGYFTLANKDGSPNTINLNNLKHVFGWAGDDPFWFLDQAAAMAEKVVQITVEDQEYNGTVRRTVRYLDLPGETSGKLPAAGDRAAILAKYGAKFRALNGGSPVKAPSATAAKPPPVKAPPPKPAAPPAPTGPQSSLPQAWDALCQQMPQANQDQTSEAWYRSVKDLIGKPQEDATPADWGVYTAKIKDWCANQLRM